MNLVSFIGIIYCVGKVLGNFVTHPLCVWGILLNESVSQWLLMGGSSLGFVCR